MITLKQIENYLKRNTKPAIVLYVMLNHKEYMTSGDIITLGSKPEKQNIFTLCPHKIIQELRDYFGQDFIKSEPMAYSNEIEFFGKKAKSIGSIFKYYVDRELIEA